MKGILVIAHGSRRKETIDTMEAVFSMAKESLPEVLAELAYMEFCDVNLEKGLDALKAKGANDITVVPYFLFSGMHIFEDIPNEIKEYLKINPNMKISIGQTLGADKRLADVLADRIRQSL